jgi:hypothetical protein
MLADRDQNKDGNFVVIDERRTLGMYRDVLHTDNTRELQQE